MRTLPCLAFALVFAALAACSPAPEPAKPAPPPPPSGPNISYAEMPPTRDYPLKTCVVTGNPLTAASRYVIAYRGYEVQFCSKGCIKEFATDPETYVLKVNPKAILR
jgi:YHS domain-containing protein